MEAGGSLHTGEYKEIALDKMTLKYCEKSPAVIKNSRLEHRGKGSESYTGGGVLSKEMRGYGCQEQNCGVGRNRVKGNTQTAPMLTGPEKEP